MDFGEQGRCGRKLRRTRTGLSEEMGCRVLDELEFVKKFEAVPSRMLLLLVDAGLDEDVFQGSSGRKRKSGVELGNVLQLNEARFGEVTDVLVKGEAAVEEDSKVSSVVDVFKAGWSVVKSSAFAGPFRIWFNCSQFSLRKLDGIQFDSMEGDK